MKRLPVLLSLVTHRPLGNGNIQIGASPRLATALNEDEAIGIGVRAGAETFPQAEGWRPVQVKVRWLSRQECADLLAAHDQEDES